METNLTRRQFLRQTAALGAGLAAYTSTTPARAGGGANNKVVVAVMGTHGRGIAHIHAYLSLPNVEIAYICDVDRRAMAKGIRAAASRQAKAPRGVKDFREVLEDPALDVLSIATPNHWHAPATILACAAGKHVYVEKPCCYDPYEGELMVRAARKYDRKVQMGNQRRSWPWVQEAIQRVKTGAIGRVDFARTWYTNNRPSIGHGKVVPVPEWLDYSLWQGPAPVRPYKNNLIHYNWHWHWHWGNGEIGNNGIHALDVARWGLGVECPRTVTCGGGRYHFHDDQETPDVYITSFDFGDKGACWESHSCHPRGFEGTGFGITFYGDKGTLVIAGNQYKIYDLHNQVVGEIKGHGGDAVHFGNFINAIRSGAALNSEIAEGVKSTLWCHLGNMAYRTGQTVHLEPDQVRITGNPEAAALWRRTYRAGWEPKV